MKANAKRSAYRSASNPLSGASGRVGSGSTNNYPVEGNRRLREFLNAPTSVQAAFTEQVRSHVEGARGFAQWWEAVESDDPAIPPYSDCDLTDPPRWDANWQRRVRAIRRAQQAPESDWTPNRDEDPLVDIPARVYVPALTGEEVPASGSMRCVLPDHDDRQPSFKVYNGSGWRCFGCGKSGTIYDLASLLWGVEPRGSGFRELHRRLRGVFA